MQRNRTYVAIGLAAILLVLIVVIVGSVLTKSNQEQKENTKVSVGNTTYIGDRSCLDSLCVENLAVSDEDIVKVLSGNFVNESSDTIEAGFVNFNISTSSGNITITFPYPSLKPGDASPIEYQFSGGDLLESKNYNLSKPTAKEIEKVKAMMVD